MSTSHAASIRQCFQNVPDPRREHMRLHNLWDIIAITGTDQQNRASFEREGGATLTGGRGSERSARATAQLGTRFKARSWSRPGVMA